MSRMMREAACSYPYHSYGSMCCDMYSASHSDSYSLPWWNILKFVALPTYPNHHMKGSFMDKTSALTVFYSLPAIVWLLFF